MISKTTIIRSAVLIGAVLSSPSARATCTNDVSRMGWGNFFIERNAAGDCKIYAYQYPCVESSGKRAPGAKTLLASVAGDTSHAVRRPERIYVGHLDGAGEVRRDDGQL